MSRVAFRNFTGGEVTPTLSARYDLKKFGSFLQVCRNFIPNLHGDVERRTGMLWVDDLPGKCVMVPFTYNTEPENNFVMLFCANGDLLVANADGIVPTGTATVTTTPGENEGDEPTETVTPAALTHPYTIDEVYEISFAQVGKFLYLAHPNHPLTKVEWTDGGSWTIGPVSINKSLPAPGEPTVTFVRGNEDDDAELSYTLRYKVTAVDEDGVESLPSRAGEQKEGRFPTDWVVGNHVTVTWPLVDNAVEYNIYRESAGYYGLVGIVKIKEKGSTTKVGSNMVGFFDDQNYEPDTGTTPKEDWNPFVEKVGDSEEDRPPATVCFHQQRMWLGGGKTAPASLYASRTGDFESFRKSFPLQDDDPLEFMLASGSIDDVHWLTSFDKLMVGTGGGEYKVGASGAAITPSDCQVTVQSYWGSTALQPIIIGQSILHAQRANRHVRDLYYTWESDSYTGNDLSVLAPQLVEGYQLRQWCFQQSPSSCLWIARSDGSLLCLTYMREQNVFGWSRHVTDGQVVSCASLSGEREDVVMLVVKRGGKYTLEKFAQRFADGDKLGDAQYLDCARTFEFSTATDTVFGTEERSQKFTYGVEKEVEKTSTPEENIYTERNGPLVAIVGGDVWAYKDSSTSPSTTSAKGCYYWNGTKWVTPFSGYGFCADLAKAIRAKSKTTDTKELRPVYIISIAATSEKTAVQLADQTFLDSMASRITSALAPNVANAPVGYDIVGIYWFLGAGDTVLNGVPDSGQSSAFQSAVTTLLTWNPLGQLGTPSEYIAEIPIGTWRERSENYDSSDIAGPYNDLIDAAIQTASASTKVTKAILGTFSAKYFGSVYKGLHLYGSKYKDIGEAFGTLTTIDKTKVLAQDTTITETKIVTEYRTYTPEDGQGHEIKRTVDKVGGLAGKKVTVLADGVEYKDVQITDWDGETPPTLTLPVAAKKITFGLPYTSVLSPMPLESDGSQGSTLGKFRGYGRCETRLYRSKGGQYGASTRNDLYDPDAWEHMALYDIPYALFRDDTYPYSGDVEFTLPSGQDCDTTIWLVTDTPYPFRVVSIMADVDFGQV